MQQLPTVCQEKKGDALHIWNNVLQAGGTGTGAPPPSAHSALLDSPQGPSATICDPKVGELTRRPSPLCDHFRAIQGGRLPNPTHTHPLRA